jgi:hypothetical protein
VVSYRRKEYEYTCSVRPNNKTNLKGVGLLMSHIFKTILVHCTKKKLLLIGILK